MKKVVVEYLSQKNKKNDIKKGDQKKIVKPSVISLMIMGI